MLTKVIMGVSIQLQGFNDLFMIIDSSCTRWPFMSFQFYSTVHFLKCSCGPVDWIPMAFLEFRLNSYFTFFFFFNFFTLNKKYYFNIFF
jgi:hypothetical protein